MPLTQATTGHAIEHWYMMCTCQNLKEYSISCRYTMSQVMSSLKKGLRSLSSTDTVVLGGL
jgi:hypothetical protein